jgi:cell division protein FtsN
MEFSRHITELLYRHDCVIVPGLGGFILREVAGQQHAGVGQFTPPSREVSFNSLLNQDDGILISYIVELQGTTYAEAKSQVSDFVNSAVNILDTGKEVTLEGIGTLGYSSELRLVFKAFPGTNFLESSFGLTPVIAHPLTEPKKVRVPERKTRPHADRKPVSVKAKTPASVKWTVAASVPVILFLLWGIIFPASFQNTYVNYSGMFSGIFENSSPVTQTSNNLQTTAIEEKTAVSEPERTQNSIQTAAMDIPAVEQQNVTVIEVPPGSTPQAAPAAELKYHVIAGVFRSRENAERYVSSLEDMGFNATLVGTDKAGRFRVSFGSFDSQAGAEEYLQHIKATENPASWILFY